MIRLIDWTARTWTFDLPVGAFPAVVERVRGTPARAAALVDGVPEHALGARVDGAWSAKDHIGHLDDLHDLDDRRLTEFLDGARTLTAADMTNRRTHDANHADMPIAVILARLVAHRAELVARLDALTEADVAATAMHPRLQRPMRLVDWLQFVAEHDDHHLVRAREALRAARL
ncbi:DinB-like domain protein (plasmid) [Gemmatirosa kalamazoonensis]|uniref:DinB-like domain protein n=1 Tax=Gemmatirosa kalamazoonensis TaxID=861299 RepID=W0RQJ0_9BACT|nr:DinB family protein [Gemmatirosa kalamazoonensis]AHG92717.1 DinB-like domain protein [Gemmatirosa kalamazoonensis]